MSLVEQVRILAWKGLFLAVRDRLEVEVTLYVVVPAQFHDKMGQIRIIET